VLGVCKHAISRIRPPTELILVSKNAENYVGAD
jgi:hypothetical protein